MKIYGVCWDGDDLMWEGSYFSTLEKAYAYAFEGKKNRPSIEEVRDELDEYGMGEWNCAYIAEFEVE